MESQYSLYTYSTASKGPWVEQETHITVLWKCVTNESHRVLQSPCPIKPHSYCDFSGLTQPFIWTRCNCGQFDIVETDYLSSHFPRWGCRNLYELQRTPGFKQFFSSKRFPNPHTGLGCLLPTLWSYHHPCAFIRLLSYWLVMSCSRRGLPLPPVDHAKWQRPFQPFRWCMPSILPNAWAIHVVCDEDGDYNEIMLMGMSNSLRVVMSWSLDHLSWTGGIEFSLLKTGNLEINWLQLKQKSVLETRAGSIFRFYFSQAPWGFESWSSISWWPKSLNENIWEQTCK